MEFLYFVNKHRLDLRKNIVLYNYPYQNYLDFKRKKIGEQVNFIYLGTIIPNREHDKIIEIFNELPKQYTLDIVGYANESTKQKLQNKIRRYYTK